MAINIRFTAQEQEVIKSLRAMGEETSRLVDENIALAKQYAKTDAESKFFAKGLNRLKDESLGVAQANDKAAQSAAKLAAAEAKAAQAAADAASKIATAEGKKANSRREAIANGIASAVGFQFGGPASGIGGAIGGLQGAAVGASIDGLVALGREVSQTTEKYNRLQMALDTATGSSKKGAEAFAFIVNIARQTGLRIDDLADSYKGFAAASKGTKLEGKETERIFTSIVKAGAAMQLSNEQVKGSLLAVSQMMSKGNVQAEELRGQLSERLSGSFNILAQEMGVTTAQLNDLLKAGAVLSEDALPKLANGLDKISKNQYAKNLNTVTGAMNNLRNEVDLVTVSFGRETNVNSFFANILNGAASIVRSGYLEKIADAILSISSIGGVVKQAYGNANAAKEASKPFQKITRGEATINASNTSLTNQKQELDAMYKRRKELEKIIELEKNLPAYQRNREAELEYKANINNYSLKKQAYEGEKIQRAEAKKIADEKSGLNKKELTELKDINKELDKSRTLLNDLKKKDPTGFTKSKEGIALMDKIGKLNKEKADLQELGKIGKPEKTPKEKISGRTSYSDEYKKAAKVLEDKVKDEKKAREDLSKSIDDLVYRGRETNGQKIPMQGIGFGFLKELQSFRSGAGLGSQVDITKLIPSAKDNKANKQWTTAMPLPDMKEQEQKIADWLNWYRGEAKSISRETAEINNMLAQTMGEGISSSLSILDGAISDFLSPEGAMKPLKDYLSDYINSIGDMMVKLGAQMITQGAILAAFGPGTGGATAIPANQQLIAGGALFATGQIYKAIKFANGGIVSGRTFAEVGEYAGARNNPEVIAPLSKLGNIFTPYFQKAVSMGRYNQPQLATQAINTQTNVYMDGKVFLQQLDKTIQRKGRI